ncbi:hypothetical protein [Coleofasciculus sp. FACHB-1120]|nr:hypothetical protein [Coleofasciculus sp. FACHB-1120]MBD2744088.1 hypothetical protein [Coleofasciculus sp. FACHB-1120]
MASSQSRAVFALLGLLQGTPPPTPPRLRGGEPEPQAMAGWGSGSTQPTI